MKTHPIPFTAPMVRAILSGMKVQTRRPVKPQPREPHWVNIPGYVLDWRNPHGATWVAEHRIPQNPQVELEHHACPYGVPGDLLWVREAFCGDRFAGVGYRATDAQSGPWTPSIHMPRWASRLTLELTDVRAQRVQEIREADARAEGISDGGCLNCGEPEPCGCAAPTPNARDSFAGLWDSIYAKGGLGWAANPWVWALSFKTHRANVDAVLAERAAA